MVHFLLRKVHWNGLCDVINWSVGIYCLKSSHVYCGTRCRYTSLFYCCYNDNSCINFKVQQSRIL